MDPIAHSGQKRKIEKLKNLACCIFKLKQSSTPKDMKYISKQKRRSFIKWINAFGFDPFKAISSIKSLSSTFSDYFDLSKQNKKASEKWELRFSSPCLNDRFDSGGTASGHYFHQDILVAQRIFKRKPLRHIDVGSRVDGFVAHVAAFREIEIYDIRENDAKVRNIIFKCQNLMDPEQVESSICDSISCLHALEHFGLGRYGDPVDIDGYKKGFESLTKMLNSGGILYLSVPIGLDRIEFNGERVFSIERIQQMYKEKFKLIDFSYVNDQGDLVESVSLEDGIDNNYNLNYGCGIFELIKL